MHLNEIRILLAGLLLLGMMGGARGFEGEAGNEPIVFEGFEPHIEILNPQAFPPINKDWDVGIHTLGKAQLTIEPTDGTRWGRDLEFQGVYCGDEELRGKRVGEKYVFENVECDTILKEKSTVRSWGKHHLQFTFGKSKGMAHNSTPDFHIQRGYVNVALNATSATITAGVDYDAPADINRAFIRIVGTKLTTSGNSVGTVLQQPNVLATQITNPTNLLTSITFARETASASQDSNITWEIIEYVGPPGGDNEIIVRDVNVATGSAANAVGRTHAGITDYNKLVVFITGYASNQSAAGTGDRMLNTSSWNSSTNQPNFTRGDTTGITRVSYALVEFVGQHWRIQRKEHTFSGTALQTETLDTNLVDINRAFAHFQFRTNSGNVDEMGMEAFIMDKNALGFQLETGATGTMVAVAWIIENLQDDGNTLQVQRWGAATGTGQAEPHPINYTINAVRDLNQTSIMGEIARSEGTGSPLPRGHLNLRMMTTTNVELWRADTANNQTYRFEVVQWPTAVYVQPPSSASTVFIFNVVTSSGHTVTYGGNCAADAFFFNETDAIFDPDIDGNGAKVKPRPTRFDSTTQKIDQNFVGVTNPSSTHVAHKNGHPDLPPTQNNEPNNEISTAEYSDISVDDTSIYGQTVQNDVNAPTVRIVFRPTFTHPQKILDFNFFMVGNSGEMSTLLSCGVNNVTPRDLNAYAWNYNQNQYDQIASLEGTGLVGPSAKQLQGIVSNNPNNYVSDDGNITILLQGIIRTSPSNKSCLSIDYVNLNVTYYPTPTDFCQSSTLSPFTITNTGGSPTNVDANFASAFAGVDLNVVLKAWMGNGTGCGSDGNGLGGWEKDCSVTGTTDPVTATTCKQWNSSNATTLSRLVSALGGGDTNQICFSGDFNGFVAAGDHNGTYQTGT